MWKDIHQMLAKAQPHVLSEVLGEDVFPKAFGRILSRLDDDSILSSRLDSIPSETSPSERRFLFNFIKYFWDGKTDILEIGPFLGGTTRAIAMGMMQNPKRQPGTLLNTYDKFDDYYTPESLREITDSLFQKGEIPSETRDNLFSTQQFSDLFCAIHSNKNYSKVLNAHIGILRDTADESISPVESCFRVPDNCNLGVVFIDGCKSWYGTKHFVLEISKVATSGAHFIFQDYGWHTCFWIPAFIELFSDFFSLIGSVDNTYTFLLKRSLNQDLINNRFADSPEEYGTQSLITLFDRIIYKNALRGDLKATLSASLQKAGALAYVGEKAMAREQFKALSDAPQYRPFSNIINMSRKSPTYTPTGPVHL